MIELDPIQLRAVLAWIQIMHEEGRYPQVYTRHGQAPCNRFVPGVADAQHSSLLQRLLEGQKVYVVPPPRAFSYPWYRLLEEIAEKGKMILSTKEGDHLTEVSYWRKTLISDKPCFVINQHPWEIAQTVKEDKVWRIRYEAEGPFYLLTKLDDGNWELAPEDKDLVLSVKADIPDLYGK